MKQPVRILVAAVALLLLVAGTAFATGSNPGQDHRFPVAASHQPASPDEDANESEPAETEPSETEPADTGKADDPADPADASAPLTDEHAATLVDLLAAQGIDATADELKTLAATYGVGGAMRLEAWAAATGQSATDLASTYDDSGLGWGAFAKQLEAGDNSLSLSPGLGWIMGHGHGHANPNPHAAAAPGQAKKSS